MSVMTSLGIIIFSMLIMALLQLVPGIFSLLQHYSFGKYYRKKASDQCLFFILGAETSIIATFLFVYYIISSLPICISTLSNSIFAWILVGILIALCLAIFFFYYRKSSGSELFISRRLARQYDQKAKTVKSRSDAFILGTIAQIPELIFTLPLYILSAIAIPIISSNNTLNAGIIILFAIVSILPLLTLHILSSKNTLADVMRFRFKNKPFFRTIISLLYLFIAIIIILGMTI